MTLPILLLYIGIVAIALTGVTVFAIKNHKSVLMTFLQFFTGCLFLFSGWVKAADPLGTAYKLQQYFDEFQYTFEPTWFSFIAPLFKWMGMISVGLSVFTIVFEMLLGIMLIVGFRPKLTSRMFFGLIVFFTALTGFTYLTGYVQQGGTFFDFSSWGPYKASNMKVTDCGCFGDFIVLEPKISFLKDVFLLIPAIYFMLRHRLMHNFSIPSVREVILIVSSVVLLLYCFRNYVWNIPHADFRPFKNGVDVKTQKEAELDAMANVDILAWNLEHETTSEKITLPHTEYMSKLATYNKKNGWKVVDQEKSKPTVKETKISHFEIEDFDGNDVTYEYLDSDNYHIMVISYKMGYKGEVTTRMVKDSIYVQDTVVVGVDTSLVSKLSDVVEREEKVTKYHWKDGFIEDYTEIIAPILAEVDRENVKTSIVTGGADINVINDFKKVTGIDANYYTADDILLKTIVRSNPGIVLWKNGKIIHKWHKSHVPTFEKLQKQFMK